MFTVAVGPDFLGYGALDAGLVVPDRGLSHRAYGDEIERAAGERAHERDELRQPLAHEARAELFGDHAPFDRCRFEECRDALLSDSDARCVGETRDRFVEPFAM